MQAGNAPAGMRFKPITPCRLLETRAEYNFEGRTYPFGPPHLISGQSRGLELAASTICNIPPAAKALVVNITLVPRGGPVDYVTVWPGTDTRPVVWSVRSPDGFIVANSAIVAIGSNGWISIYSSHDTDAIIDISGYFTLDTQVANLAFFPMAPCRVIDTRALYRPQSGPFGPPSMQALQTRRFKFPETPYCQIPAGASAYSVTITAVPPDPLMFLTAWPAGGPQPNVSSINSPQKRVLANSVVIPAGADGAIDVFTLNQTDVLMDINGYFAPDDGTNGLFYFPLPLCRVSSTQDTGLAGAFGPPQFGDETSRVLPVRQSPCATTIPPNVKAYALTVTAMPGGSPMPFITAWPAGSAMPNASILNAFDGQIVTNSAIVPAGTDGSVSVYTYRKTHVVVEISGYFAR